MRKQILKIGLFSFLIMLTVVSCNMPDNNTDPNVLYTLAASTIQAENNRIASLTPPTPTATATNTPTVTPTFTVTPTPTIAPTATLIVHPAGAAEVLILFYNDVANDAQDDPYYQWESPLNVPSIEFEQQVRVLSELGYQSIGISQLVKVLLEGGELPEKPVMFTFDSTKRGQFVNAYPILKKYGMVGNLMLDGTQVDTKNCLSSEQIREMMDSGWEIGGTGQEIGKTKASLQEKFDVDILAYSYPGGIPDGEGKMYASVSNNLYRAAFGKQHFTKQTMNTLFYLGRYEITKGLPYNDFLSYLPWKDGNISDETLNWTQPKATLAAPVAETQGAPDTEAIGEVTAVP